MANILVMATAGRHKGGVCGAEAPLPERHPGAVMAYIVMADIVMAQIVMAYIVMAYIVMSYIFMAYVVMAYIVRPM